MLSGLRIKKLAFVGWAAGSSSSGVSAWLPSTFAAFCSCRPRTSCRAAATNAEDNHDSNNDWMQAEFFLLNCPQEPSPELSAETVAVTVARSLQWVDHPYENAGLERIYNFLTFDCRKAVTGRQGGSSVERFCEYGLLAPALQPYMGAQLVEIDAEHATVTAPPQPPHRGALASFGVAITGADVLQRQHPSGLPRSTLSQAAPVVHMVLRLEQKRRPPLQGCWLVKEMMDVRYAFAGDMGNEIPG